MILTLAKMQNHGTIDTVISRSSSS
jgi:hypothetical protein